MKNCGSGESDKNKTKLACILEADESTRMRMEILNLQITKTILQEKVRIIATLQFGSQIYSYASSYENPSSESSGGQGMGKVGEIFGVELDKSQQ